ncbi:MAG: OsmC family protein [Firmicutes bacterium]|nr:OsmC family protein [Bacillota bacterium]
MKVNLTLKNDNIFEATNERGITIDLGAGIESGPSPMEVLLMAVGGCSGIDVLSTLKKMRQPISGLKISVAGTRRDEHPRYFTEVQVTYKLSGDLESAKVQRAIELSLDKYCSVSNMIEPKAKVSYKYEIIGGDSN